jgi:hypothetical protein
LGGVRFEILFDFLDGFLLRFEAQGELLDAADELLVTQLEWEFGDLPQWDFGGWSGILFCHWCSKVLELRLFMSFKNLFGMFCQFETDFPESCN